jgi:hypothetical protein
MFFFFFLVDDNMSSFQEEAFYGDLLQAYREVEVTWQCTTNKHKLEVEQVNKINCLFVKTEHLLNKASTAIKRRECWVHIFKIVSLLDAIDLQLNYG